MRACESLARATAGAPRLTLLSYYPLDRAPSLRGLYVVGRMGMRVRVPIVLVELCTAAR